MPTDFDHFLALFTVIYQLLAMSAALVIGTLFFFKRSGSQPANWLYGALLILCAGVQLHFIFAANQWPFNEPEWPYLPIYFSLSLPVLFFFHVKLTLFPDYRLKASDAKHGILPIGQMLYVWAIFLVTAWRIPGGRYFYNPFYGGLEQALFIFLFPMYIVFGYQYYRARKRALKPGRESRQLWYIHKLLKGTMLFVLAYAILGISDFIVHKFFYLDLREQRWFLALSAGSFSSLVIFFGVYGFQVLLWGRKLLKRRNPKTKERQDALS
ncbi:hypothetical protein CEQ90_14975 [Lewinellaceae bacterium SD302]|nr:hypothetical protein CEQ90_14975 [Lewinellaceae bacterium SD302]